MDVQDAIKILNEKCHNGYSEWEIAVNDEIEDDEKAYAKGEFYYDNLTSFEAIAVAEKYVREG